MRNPVFNSPKLLAKFSALSQWIAYSLLLGLLTSTSNSAIALPTQLPLVAQSQSTPTTNRVQTQLQGRWEVKDPVSGQTLTLIFTPDNKLFMLLPLGSGAPVALPFGYRINPTPKPMHLDVILPEPNQVVLTIFELTDKGQLRLQLAGTNPGQPRPTAFTADADVFQKISEETTLPPDVLTAADMKTQGEQMTADLERQAQTARETEGKLNVAAMSRAQQAFQLEFEKFAPKFEDISIGFQPETDNYSYRIVPQGNQTQSVMMTARSKRPELRSYTGAVFVVKSETNDMITITGTCETDQPSSKPPAMPATPRQSTDKIKCPVGSHLVGR
ncbi:type IV pilin-like G/H family protein [Allocoleopsis sp.]|uniref:type IV pilin-like G/H family protein n=1 Tax=Allocoleopsis sp. TaxID=3088169 RepID=UPI002FD6B96C